MAYCTRTQIETRFGTSNVAKWAKLEDGDEAADITARIVEAIAEADNEINDALRLVYDVPFAAVPTTIESVSVDLAAVYLYDARGIHDTNDFGEQRHRMSFVEKRARAKLKAFQTGQRFLDIDDAPDLAPTVVEDENDSDSDWDDPTAGVVGW